MVLLQATTPSATDMWKSVFTLLVLLALFGYLGWRRGAAQEAAFTATILIASLVQSNTYGARIIDFINNISLLVQIAVRGRFSLSRMMELVQKEQFSPLIPEAQREAAQFVLFFAVLFLGYWISTRLPARPSAMGLVMGLVNGYLIGALVLPLLPPGLPAVFPGGSASGSPNAVRVLEEGTRQLEGVLGLGLPNLALLLMAFFVIWAALKLR